MAEVVNLENKKLLVVEDDDMNYLYLIQLFKLTKGDIHRAKMGRQAIDMATEENFDLILMDIQLPDITGNDVTRKIRESDQETPIIAQTASRTPEDVDAAMDAGCTDVLIKPFTINDFSRIVRKYIR